MAGFAWRTYGDIFSIPDGGQIHKNQRAARSTFNGFSIAAVRFEQVKKTFITKRSDEQLLYARWRFGRSGATRESPAFTRRVRTRW